MRQFCLRHHYEFVSSRCVKMDVERFRSVAAVPATCSCRRSRRSFHFPSVFAVAPPIYLSVCPRAEGVVSDFKARFCQSIPLFLFRPFTQSRPYRSEYTCLHNRHACCAVAIAAAAPPLPSHSLTHSLRRSHMLWFQAKSDN